MFLDFWCYQTMRSRIEPMKKIARTLRTHRELLLNYFKARKKLSSGVVEGLILLCYKRRRQQNGQQGSCRRSALAILIRSVAIELALCRSARTR